MKGKAQPTMAIMKFMRLISQATITSEIATTMLMVMVRITVEQ